MRILLVGEYNRTHKSLKEGLVELGHEAIVLGLTDGFKKVDVDIEINNKFQSGINKKIRALYYRIFNSDIYSKEVLKQIKSKHHLLKGFDVVQFVNESPFLCLPKIEEEIFNLLIKWNGKPFLLSCGTDFPSVKYAFDKKFRYSILTPFFEGRVNKSDFSLGLKYLRPDFVRLHKHIYHKIAGVISCDLDYYLPLQGNNKHIGMIPHAINTAKIKFMELEVNDKIVIFHGINRRNYFKKGNDIFEGALEIVKEKFSHKIEIITVENLPYKDYLLAFDRAHILLDQVYAYDQGYNALEAMAKGKVVFTGAEKEWLDYYNLEEDKVAINALPNEEKVAEKLVWLIENPNKILEISKNARHFVEQYHNHSVCAKQYLNFYQG